MTYLPQVIEARHVRKFIVSTRFDDGIEKDIDISQWFNGSVFEPLRNLKNFQEVLCGSGNTCLAKRCRYRA